MGALHEGHISLVQKAKETCDVVVVSIFVNPTQFNNADDFAKYPITLDADSKLLEQVNCDLLFTPSKEIVYDDSYVMPEFDLGIYDEVLEGKFRPDHFSGVVQVVYRFFDLVKPDKAFFGLKDYQQVAVIKKMTRFFELPIEIVACPTIREKDGLAMSSRNTRLSASERKQALFINKSLKIAEALVSIMSPEEVKSHVTALYAKSVLKLEYFEIIHPVSFKKLTTNWVSGSIACVVAYSGEVRLIDNMSLTD